MGKGINGRLKMVRHKEDKKVYRRASEREKW